MTARAWAEFVGFEAFVISYSTAMFWVHAPTGAIVLSVLLFCLLGWRLAGRHEAKGWKQGLDDDYYDD